MLSVSELEDRLGDENWVVVRPSGEIVEMEIPSGIGPATLIVGAVTDALKVREGRLITGSLDRDEVWAVEAFAINRVVLDRLEGVMEPMDLYRAVVDIGLAWRFYEGPLA